MKIPLNPFNIRGRYVNYELKITNYDEYRVEAAGAMAVKYNARMNEKGHAELVSAANISNLEYKFLILNY